MQKYNLIMRYLLYSSVIALLVAVLFFAFNSKYFNYYTCMLQTKSDYITKKGADHVGAQCKAFILEEIMVKN